MGGNLRWAVVVVGLVAGVGVYVGCGAYSPPSEHTGGAPYPTSSAAVKARALDCPVLGIRGTHPQSALYQGKCLEVATYFVSDKVKAGVTNGRLDVGGDALMYHEGAATPEPVDVNVLAGKFSRVTAYENTFQLYELKTKSGGYLCSGQEYKASAKERSTYCTTPDDSACTELTGKALIVPGYWDKTAAAWIPDRKDDQGRDMFSFSCVSGVEAKCLMWGYYPWDKARAPYYKACVNAARAHYLDEASANHRDDSYTCQDTEIDIYDNFPVGAGVIGIQKRDSQMSFESLWDDKGLLCLWQPRWARCSKLDKLLSGDVHDKCKDPESNPSRAWDATVGGRAIVAVASKVNSDANDCPNTGADNPNLKCESAVIRQSGTSRKP